MALDHESEAADAYNQSTLTGPKVDKLPNRDELSEMTDTLFQYFVLQIALPQMRKVIRKIFGSSKSGT